MEHVIMHGIDASIDKARLLVRLYTKHAALADLVKASSGFMSRVLRHSLLALTL